MLCYLFIATANLSAPALRFWKSADDGSHLKGFQQAKRFAILQVQSIPNKKPNAQLLLVRVSKGSKVPPVRIARLYKDRRGAVHIEGDRFKLQAVDNTVVFGEYRLKPDEDRHLLNFRGEYAHDPALLPLLFDVEVEVKLSKHTK